MNENQQLAYYMTNPNDGSLQQQAAMQQAAMNDQGQSNPNIVPSIGGGQAFGLGGLTPQMMQQLMQAKNMPLQPGTTLPNVSQGITPDASLPWANPANMGYYSGGDWNV